jgi:class 3 adenylate cyclase
MVIYGAAPIWRTVPDVPGTAAAEAFAVGMLHAVESAWGTAAGLHYWIGDELDTPEARAISGRVWRNMVSPRDAAQIIKMLGRIDVRGILPTVTCPTLVIAAHDDVVAPPETCRWMAAQLPNARYAELPGPHNPFSAHSDIDGFIGLVEEFFTGNSPASPSNRVLTTVLFTDIVASTTIATVLHDRRWRHVLEEHDAIAHHTVERHRGRVIKSTGDGILALFDGPGRAVRCAIELASAIESLGLQLRAGVHTGEVELRSDGDVSGIAVHLASRVQATAVAGQVLVSRTVVDLTFGSELTFVPRGPFHLKGIDGTWELYAASIDR